MVLVHSHARILPELSDGLAQYAQELLERRGVEMRTEQRVVGATPDYAQLDDGTRIPTKTLVSTVPSGANPIVAALPCTKEKGRIVVNGHLEVPGHPGMWAAGDCAWVVESGAGKPCPPTAQHAIRQARCLAANIVASIDGRPKQTFAFRQLGQLAALGHRSAVAEILGLKLHGFLAWWLWRSIYLMKMPGLDRKLRVTVDWTLDLFCRRTSSSSRRARPRASHASISRRTRSSSARATAATACTSIVNGVGRCGQHRDSIRGVESVPMALRHDDQHPRPHREGLRPGVRHDGERSGAVQDVPQLVALPMALPGTVFRKGFPGEDAAVAKRGQHGERPLGFGFGGAPGCARSIPAVRLARP